MTQQQSKVSVRGARNRRSEVLRRAVRAALHVMTPAALLALSVGPAVAGPQDGIVVRGAASIETPAANVLNVNQTTDRAVINWRSFSIGAEEQVNFNQPTSSSATLNRVLGGQRSIIEGALSANGQVFLLNSSGVLFTSSAKVDVGGLVATTSTLRNDDFMAGDLNFVASGQALGEIANEGTITVRDGGMAALVAPTVRNQGIISARLGRIALGAGETFTLDLYGDQLINFALPGASGGGLAERGLEQAGSLIADGGQVLLTTDAAAGIVGGVVNMSGIVQARTVEQNARGEIVLAGAGAAVEVSGRLDASGRDAGGQGGSIDVFGQSVHLSNSAVVDATGSSGGGAVRVGGGFAADNTPRADTTIVAEGATIDVSATDAGNAGTVAVWGDDSAHFAGTIRARGGEHGGDGGFVEVSSKGLLQFLGDAITDAPTGQAGTVLLDPPSIRVEAVGSIDPTAAIVSAAALNGMLRRGTPVVLLADDSITVNATIDGRSPSGSGPSGLVDMRAGSIILMQPVLTERNTITLSATSGNVTFGANAFLYVADSTSQSTVGTSAITINAVGSIDAQSLISLGQINLTATTGNVALAGQFGANNSGAATGIGSLTVNAGGNATLQGARTSGSVTVTAGGSVANSGNSIVAGGNVAFTSGAGGISLGALPGNAPGIDALATSAVALRSPGAVALGSGIRTAGGDITIGTSDGRVASVTDGAGSGPATTGVLFAGGSGDVEIQAENLVELRGVSAGGSIIVNTNGRLTNVDNAIVANGGGIALTAGDDEGEGIDVRGPAGSAALQAAAGSVVDLRTRREVTLGGGVRALGGTINVGNADARVNGLTVLDGTVLQTFSGAMTGGAINVFSADGVDGHGTVAAPVGFVTNALTIDSIAGLVQLDGLFGIAGGADHIGSLTVSALGAGGDVELRGARTSGEVNVTASGSVSNTDSTVISDGNVELAAGAGGITMASLAGAPAIDARSTADVVLRTTGDVILDAGVRTAAGDILIGSNAPGGRVASLSDNAGGAADSGFTLEAGGAGRINAYADGEVSLRGASAGGVITIDTTGRLENLENSIRSRDGSIDLIAGGDDGEGIDVRSGGDFAVLQAGPGADVNLRTTGSVTVGGGVRAIGGAISVGTDPQPVASFTLLSGGYLQTFDTALAGSIDIFSTGAISARSTTSNPTRLITDDLNLDAVNGSVTLDGLVGLNVGSTTTGIGSLTVTTGSAGAVSLREVDIASQGGGIAITAGSGGIDFTASASPVDSALRVRQGSGAIDLQTSGRVVLGGSLSTAAGDITIGSQLVRARALEMASGTQLRTGSGAVDLFLGTDASNVGRIVGGPATEVTVLSGSTVNFRGPIGGADPDPEVFADDPKSVHVEATGIVYRGAETSGNDGGTGVSLEVGSGGHIDLYGETHSHNGSVFIGSAAGDAEINLSHNIRTDGFPIALNGNVILFDGIGRWGGRSGQAALERALDSATDPFAFLADLFAPRERGLDEVTNGFFSNPSVEYTVDPRLLCTVFADCTPGPAELMRFIGDFELGRYDLHAYYNDAPVGTFNTFDAGDCAAWICGYHNTADRALAVLQDEAVLRETRFQRLLGALSARIDTTGNGASGENVHVTGSVSRYVGPRLDPQLTDVAAVPDAYVNHELVIAVGGAQFDVDGTFGDTDGQSTLTYTIGTLVADAPVGLETHRILETRIGLSRGGMPELGQFNVVIESGALDIGLANADHFVNSISGAGQLTGTSTLDQRPIKYVFPNPWTSPSNGALRPGTAPQPSDPFPLPNIGNVIGGSSGPGANAPPPNQSQSGDRSSGLGPGSAQVGTSVGANGTPAPSDPGAVSFGVLSTVDDQQRDDDPVNDGEQASRGTDDVSPERCARGAAQEADLGATRAVDGAAADVFERCPEGS